MKKNNYSYIWVSLVILVFGIIFIPRIVTRINQGNIVVNEWNKGKKNMKELSFISINGINREVPSFALLNQDSLVITNEDYLGKVYVVEFFFTTCPSICPVMSENLVAIQDTFKTYENFGVASITINPVFDTPRVLKDYAVKYGITNKDWHLLTGDSQEIYDLANLGFNIFAGENNDAPGGFEHSGLFALIDKNGFIRSRLDNFGNPLIYYRGTITEAQGNNAEGEQEQISILREDIENLLMH